MHSNQKIHEKSVSWQTMTNLPNYSAHFDFYLGLLKTYPFWSSQGDLTSSSSSSGSGAGAEGNARAGIGSGAGACW